MQAFLHSHNRPQLSLHEEMVRREKEREREEQHRQQAEVEASRLREEERVHGGTIPTIALTGTVWSCIQCMYSHPDYCLLMYSHPDCCLLMYSHPDCCLLMRLH